MLGRIEGQQREQAAQQIVPLANVAREGAALRRHSKREDFSAAKREKGARLSQDVLFPSAPRISKATRKLRDGPARWRRGTRENKAAVHASYRRSFDGGNMYIAARPTAIVGSAQMGSICLSSRHQGRGRYRVCRRCVRPLAVHSTRMRALSQCARTAWLVAALAGTDGRATERRGSVEHRPLLAVQQYALESIRPQRSLRKFCSDHRGMRSVAKRRGSRRGGRSTGYA